MSYYKTINLLKRTVPYMGEGIYEHDYLAFGQFDVLDILEVKHSLKELWKCYKETEIKLRKNLAPKTKYFSSQPLFLARNEHWKFADDFLDIQNKEVNYKEYPFIFIVLLHARDDIPKNKSHNSKDAIERLVRGNFDSFKEENRWQSWMENVCTKINNKQKELKNFIFECYYPLNFSQGAVCIYANSYVQITKLLANLVRENQEISYAYTISGLKNTWIENEEKLKQDENVEVSFDIVINHMDEFYKLRDDLKNKLQADEEREIVGNADVRLTYKNVSINSLISAYKNFINPQEKNYKYGVSTLISTWSCKAELDNNKEWLTNISLNEDKHKDIEPLFAGSKENEDPLSDYEYDENKKPLYSLLEVAEMLSKSEYIRYIDTVIGATMKALLDNIRNFKTLAVDKEKKEYVQDVNSFLHHSQDLLSSTLRADRQFFEVPGFNMILDEIPIKLVIAYHFCLYELRMALRSDKDDKEDKERKYAFLAYPKMTDNTINVLRLFLDQKNITRLYCMSLPWDGIFNIRWMLPQLAHEIGHCILNNARNREDRYKKYLELISKLLVHKIYFFDEETDKECINRFEEKYYERIKKYDDAYTNPKQDDKQNEDLIKQNEDLIKQNEDLIKLYEDNKHKGLIKQYKDRIKQNKDRIKQNKNRKKQNEDLIKLYEDLINQYEDLINQYKDQIKQNKDQINQYKDQIKQNEDKKKQYEDKKKQYEEERYYNHTLQHSLLQAVEWGLLDKDFHYQMSIEYGEIKHLSTDEFKTRFLTNKEWAELEKYEHISQDNRINMLCNITSFNFRTIVEFTLHLGSECFADLFMIMVLGMDYNAYLLSFKDAGCNTSFLIDVYQFARIKAVYNALAKANIWNDEGCQNNTDNDSSTKTLNKDETKYLDSMKEILNGYENKTIIKMMNETIVKYLTKCIQDLKLYNFDKKNLLTKKLYHDSWGSKNDNGAINYIQELLWKVGGEI